MAAALRSSPQLWFPGQVPPKVKSFSTLASSTNETRWIVSKRRGHEGGKVVCGGVWTEAGWGKMGLVCKHIICISTVNCQGLQRGKLVGAKAAVPSLSSRGRAKMTVEGNKGREALPEPKDFHPCQVTFTLSLLGICLCSNTKPRNEFNSFNKGWKCD